MKKILMIGESWVTKSTHIKGFDTFTSVTYLGGVEWIKKAFESGGYEVEHMPCHVAAEHFPFTIEDMNKYDMIVFSDIGSNTLLLPNLTFVNSVRTPNRLNLIEEYVNAGGAFLMVGGYMSFTGIDCKGRYADTAIERILPVDMLKYDDRVELPQGLVPTAKDHAVLSGIDGEWPFFLGYNKTVAKAEAEVVAEIEGNPFIALREVGAGRTAVFTSDCSPHWGPPEFVNWKHYGKLWNNLADWLTKK